LPPSPKRAAGGLSATPHMPYHRTWDKARVKQLRTPSCPPQCYQAAGLTRALAQYDAERRSRTEKIVRAAPRIGRLAQTQAPIAVSMRTLLRRLIPPSLSLRMVQRITAWTLPLVPSRYPK
jgi:hypothetical protein